MELNPCEAIKNNVRGTRIVGEAAVRHGVERFVLISSDKAVNPSSVMGATKRVAELLAMALAERGPTGFVVVRFGNVIGSNGSVIPLFLEQIKGGRAGHRHASRDASLLHADPGSGAARAPGRRPRREWRALRPRHGRRDPGGGHGAEPDPAVRLHPRARDSDHLHRGAARREALGGAGGLGRDDRAVAPGRDPAGSIDRRPVAPRVSGAAWRTSSASPRRGRPAPSCSSSARWWRCSGPCHAPPEVAKGRAILPADVVAPAAAVGEARGAA